MSYVLEKHFQFPFTSEKLFEDNLELYM